jgi:hypothetical protein
MLVILLYKAAPCTHTHAQVRIRALFLNAALMFYNNLAPDIHNQINASGYFPPETFSDNSSQVQALRALRDSSLKVELEVASIIRIIKRAKWASTHACFPGYIPTKQIFPSPSSYAPVMAVLPAMSIRNQLFSLPPNPPHQVFTNIQSSHVILPRAKILSIDMTFMRNAIVVSQRMRYRKRTYHLQVYWKMISVGDVQIYTQAIVFISYMSARTEKTQ